MRNEDKNDIDNEDFRQSLNRYEEMLSTGEACYMDADELVDVAEYYTNQGEKEKAEACIDYALKLHPGSAEPLVFRARQYILYSNDYDKAREICEGIEDKNNTEVIYLTSELMMHDGDIDKANSYLHRMADPEDEEYLYYLYDVAQIFVDHNLHHEALEWVNEALKVDSDDVESKVLKGEILVNLENMDAAIEFLSHTLDEMPYSVECWNLLSQAHYIAEHYNDAIDACDFVLAIDEKNTEALLMKANCFYHLENSEEAHKLYERYSTLNPDDEMAYFFNGVTLFDMGRYKESLEQLLTAEKVSQGYSPDMGQIYVQLAFTYSKLENTEAAVEYINKALDLEPDDAELFAIRGHLEVAGGERKKGADDYCQALQMTHNDENMLFKIAMSLYDNELFNSSLRLFRNLVEVDEEKWRHLYPFIALCHLYLNHGHKYLEYLKMACETDSANAKEVLGPLFPDMNPSDYYAYALKMWKSKKPQRPKKQ